MIREIICKIFGHKWDGRLWRAYADKTKVVCARCGHEADFRNDEDKLPSCSEKATEK